MRKSLWLVAAAGLVVVSNTWLLLHAARNRWRGVESEVEMTERELRIDAIGTDDSALRFTLQWRSTGQESWLDQRKLEELGFDCTLPASHPEAAIRYRRVLPRPAFVALEYDGPAWAEWVKSQRERIRRAPLQNVPGYPGALTLEEQLERDIRTGSRLVAADVARDAETLRQRHPERARVVITRAVVRMWYEPAFQGSSAERAWPARLRGAINELPGQFIHLPQPFSGQLGPQLKNLTSWSHFATPAPQPRYRVRLRFGAFLEPWVAGLAAAHVP
ncbi:MAG: DUF4824 family protein [Acidobacteria bacterium]|nr:DUF4824 family protein [Acidobacteriota bacterium]